MAMFDFLDGKQHLKLTSFCQDTRCSFSRGRPTEEIYELVLISRKGIPIKRDSNNEKNEPLKIKIEKLVDIPGVGNKTAQRLRKADILKPEDLLENTAEEIALVSGLKLEKIETLIQVAKENLGLIEEEKSEEKKSEEISPESYFS